MLKTGKRLHSFRVGDRINLYESQRFEDLTFMLVHGVRYVCPWVLVGEKNVESSCMVVIAVLMLCRRRTMWLNQLMSELTAGTEENMIPGLGANYQGQ